MFIFKILSFMIGLIFGQIHFFIFMLHRIAVRVSNKWQTAQFGKSSNLYQRRKKIEDSTNFFLSQEDLGAAEVLELGSRWDLV